MFVNLVREFYSNLKFEDLSWKTPVKGTKINIRRDQLGIMFELPFYGVSYTYDGPIKFKIFKLSTKILYFIMNLMEDNMLHIKATYLKAKICVEHYFYHNDTTSQGKIISKS